MRSPAAAACATSWTGPGDLAATSGDSRRWLSRGVAPLGREHRRPCVEPLCAATVQRRTWGRCPDRTACPTMRPAGDCRHHVVSRRREHRPMRPVPERLAGPCPPRERGGLCSSSKAHLRTGVATARGHRGRPRSLSPPGRDCAYASERPGYIRRRGRPAPRGPLLRSGHGWVTPMTTRSRSTGRDARHGGLCLELLPEVLTADDWNYPIASSEPPLQVPAAVREHAEAAVRGSPSCSAAGHGPNRDPVTTKALRRWLNAKLDGLGHLLPSRAAQRLPPPAADVVESALGLEKRNDPVLPRTAVPQETLSSRRPSDCSCLC